MATKHTITGKLGDLVGPIDLRSVTAVVRTNLGAPTVIDSVTGVTHVGDGPVAIGQDGSFSLDLLPSDSPDLNVTGIQYWLDVSMRMAHPMVHGGLPERETVSFGPFAVTGPGTFASLAPQFDTPAVAPSWRDQFRDEMLRVRDVAEAARRVVNPAALGPWWAACAKRTTQPARAVFLGSSTTAGYNATAPENRWVNRLITQMQGIYPSGSGETAVMQLSAGSAAPPTAPGIQGFNAGIAATTSATYCQAATLYGIGVLNPTLVVHMIGSNDSVPGTFFVPVEQYKANVLAAIDSMASHRAHLLVHTYRRFGTSVTKAQWAAYGAALREIAEERANVAFLDISGDYEQAYGTTDPLDLIDTDMVHQTDAGHAFMAETIALYLGLAGQTGEGKVDKVETRTAPAASRRINLSYVISALQANLSEVSIAGVIRSWRNEWGAFRGRNPYPDYADAVVRGIVESGDYTGTGNGGGNVFEVVNRLLPEGRLRQMWGVRWATGKVVRNGVEVPDLWMRGSASSALEAEIPPGSVLVTLDGEKSGPRSTIASWSGGALPTVSGTVTVDAAVGVPSAPALKIGNDASAAYARFDFAAQPQVAARAYIRTPASWSSSAATILALRPTSSTIAVGVALTGTASPGRVRLTTTGGTIIAESPAILSVSTDYRIEVRYNSGTNTSVLAVYALGQDVPAWSSGPIAHASLTSTITRVDVGRVNNSPTVPEWWVDNIDVLDGSGGPVGRHATDALSSTPLPTPPYVGPVGYWDGATLLPLLNHRTPASDIDYAGGPVLPSSSVEAALDALDQRTGLGATVADGVDLNTLTDTGVYFRGNSVGSTVALNYPEEGWSGFLQVSRSATGTGPVVQEALAIYSSNGVQTTNGTHFYRTRISNTWNPWMRVLTTKDVTPKALTAAQDLNLVLEPGGYSLTASGSTTALGWPFAGFQGHIEVLNVPARNVMIQRATLSAALGGFQPGTEFIRALHGTVWGAWQQTLASRDSGWRDISSVVTWSTAKVNTADAQAPFCRARRVNDTVEVTVYFRSAAAGTLDPATTGTILSGLPSGFGATVNGGHAVPVQDRSTNRLMPDSLAWFSGTDLTGRLGSAGFLTRINATYTTTQAYPTTLPGTAA